MHEWMFQDEIKLSPLHLPRAALLVAREIAYPVLDIGYYLEQLDHLAKQASDVINPAEPLAVRAELLANYLFKQLDFRGNEEDYADPRNSFLNEVLERRLGIPITLSVIYMAVAQQLQIPAQGVGLPGHFIVSVRDQDRDYFFDPFHRGGRLSLNDCARLVQRTTGHEGPFRAEWLAPTQPRDILARMLNNLRIITIQQEMLTEATKTLACLVLVQPNEPQFVRDLGLMHYRLGAFREASYYLDQYLRLQPEASDAAVLRQIVDQTLTRWAALN
jgi:regulator of sirC expression with transglutaminase-like and TPR domain